VEARIKVVMPLGPQVVYEAEIGAGCAVKVSAARDARSELLAPGDRVYLKPITPEACRVFEVH
jgi:hypothetical protein